MRCGESKIAGNDEIRMTNDERGICNLRLAICNWRVDGMIHEATRRETNEPVWIRPLREWRMRSPPFGCVMPPTCQSGNVVHEGSSARVMSSWKASSSSGWLGG